MTAEEMWRESGLRGTYQAWAFGGAPDKLAELVRKGVKTATCSAAVLYEQEIEELPKAGERSVILDSAGHAVCVIQTTRVYVTPFDRVSRRHAFLEGEGDRSLAYWRRVHKEFFTEELKTIHREFHEKMSLVCEEFEVIYPQPSGKEKNEDR